MKKTLIFLLLVTTSAVAFAESGKPVPTAFELKADALLDEAQYQLTYNQADPDWTAFIGIADWLIKQPNFNTQWAAYISSQQDKRPSPVTCIANAIANYAICAAYYSQMCVTNNGTMQPCHGMEPPSPNPNLGACAYNLTQTVSGCNPWWAN